MQCFKCEKPLQMLVNIPENPNDAGQFVLSFCYGSRHDQLLEFEGHRGIQNLDPEDARHLHLGNADQIRGYVCDDCFGKFAHLLEGWDVKTTRTEGKVV